MSKGDGPKNSQGFANALQAGVSFKEPWLDVLDYEGGKLNRAVFEAWWHDLKPEQQSAIVVRHLADLEAQQHPFAPFIRAEFTGAMKRMRFHRDQEHRWVGEWISAEYVEQGGLVFKWNEIDLRYEGTLLDAKDFAWNEIEDDSDDPLL